MIFEYTKSWDINMTVVKESFDSNLQEWILTKARREQALAKRHQVMGVEWSAHTKVLGELEVGCVVQVKNQTGPHANK